MAGFTEDLQTQYLRSLSLPFLEIDSNMEFINQYSELNGIVPDNTVMNLHSVLGCCNDNFLSQIPMQPEFPTSAGCPSENLSGFFTGICADSLPFTQQPGTVGDGNRGPNSGNTERKLMTVSDCNSWSSSTPISETRLGEDDKLTTRKIPGRGKRMKSGNNNKVSKEKRVEKPKEVIHVRARRGQATDSHSLAERVRREKINERMRCLQDLVPGCYKTMGMAVMLDEIINYVQSLQNQVEFLSMKLAAASSCCDFSLDLDAVEGQQQQVQFQQLYRV